MSIYCISDVHGCYDRLIELLKVIDFDASKDTLYVLGDVIDRGEGALECLKFVMNTPGVHFIRGNHEQMLLDYYDENDKLWLRNNTCGLQYRLQDMPKEEFENVISFLRETPLFESVIVSGRNFLLSHSGFDIESSCEEQTVNDYVWSRDEFFRYPTKKDFITIFGHTPTFLLSGNRLSCSIWYDTFFNDKICIDSGCVFGGALSAIRLDDLEAFYVKETHRGAFYKYSILKNEDCKSKFKEKTDDRKEEL